VYWVVRESVKRAFRRRAIKFNSQKELIESGKKIGKIKFNFDCSGIFRKSKLLKEKKEQKILREWF